MPGHCAVEDNEKADKFAGADTNTDFIVPEPMLSIPKCHIKMELKDAQASILSS